MVTDGGGWTLVLAQYEDDPVTNWNEGIQSDYDPSLTTKKGFALNTSQIPAHNQVAFGKDLNPTAVDYVNFNYITGDIAVTTVISPKTAKGYQVHRSVSGYYYYGDPEDGYNSSTYPELRNGLTFDELGGNKLTWTFFPLQTSIPYRGYAYGGSNRYNVSDSYAWTVWVRSGTVETAKTSCKAWYDSGKTTDGYYSINPNGTAFTTYCDMANGGWTLIGNVLGGNPVYATDYSNGKGSVNYLPQSEWIHKVSDFNTYTNPAMRINMGTVTDYFIPNGVSFSTMVTSSPATNFKWTNNLTKPFVVPDYYSGHLGGSAVNWPANNVSGDSRYHLSFWGSNISTANGGCCQNSNTDTSTWGKGFKMWIKESVLEPTYQNSNCNTIKTATGTTISGNYTIDPDGAGGSAPFQAYCDMVTDGGGWTRVTGSIANSSVPFGTNGLIRARNNPRADCVASTNFTISGFKFTYSSYRIYLTRESTILQCSYITNGSYYYKNGSSWVPGGTCLWGDGIWANACCGTSLGSLKPSWLVTGSYSPTLTYTTTCSDSSDNGYYSVYLYIR
jgi:hypothetical protein